MKSEKQICKMLMRFYMLKNGIESGKIESDEFSLKEINGRIDNLVWVINNDEKVKFAKEEALKEDEDIFFKSLYEVTYEGESENND